MSKNIITLISAFFLTCIFSACGDSTLYSTPRNYGEGVLPPSFALAGDFPSDIVIPNIEGMKSIAFIVSTSSPAGVLAVDIDANPMVLSSEFAGLRSPDGSGIPAKLAIQNADRAFMLTSNSVVCFSPKSGDVLSTTAVLRDVNVGAGRANSDGSSSPSTIATSYPSSIALLGDTLFVSTSNYIRTEAPALAAPGTVLVFEIGAECAMNFLNAIVTTGYNPTGLAIRNDEELIVTNSGVLSIVDATAVPETDSSVDIVDVNSLNVIANINLGLVSASFHAMAITSDGTRGFVGSSAYGEVYELDLANRKLLRGPTDPIVVSETSDLITDVKLSVDDTYIFAASFEQSAVYPFSVANNFEKKTAHVVGFPSGVTDQNPSGANTGAGALAVRPGTRGVDYQGADLFILTGYPGALVAVKSDAPAIASPQTDSNELVEEEPSDPPSPPVGDAGASCQGFAQAVFSVSYGAGAGFGQSKMPNIVLGPPQGKGASAGSLDVLSLGTNGEIILDLGNCPAVNGLGADFIVFENAFYAGGNPKNPFAELGVVSASEDGVNFFEFPCASLAYPFAGCAGSHPVYSNSTNGISPFDAGLAGGEGYDLSKVGLTKARYIKIKDVNGSGSGGGAGFDLDAVAVVNGKIE